MPGFSVFTSLLEILGSIKFSTKDLEDINKVPPGGLSISRTFETDLLFLLHFDIIFTTTQKRSEQKVEVEKQKNFLIALKKVALKENFLKVVVVG